MKTCVSVILLIVVVVSPLLFVYAANASAGWSQICSGGPYDSLFPCSVIQTSDGGYALAIFTIARPVDDIGYTGHINAGLYELHLVKTDTSGIKQWDQKYVGSTEVTSEFYGFSPETQTTLIQTSNGEYVIGTYGNSRYWLLKTDTLGNPLWVKAIMQDDTEHQYYLSTIIQMNDGGFAIGGSADTLESRDFCLVKVDSQGNTQWSQVYNSGTYTDPSNQEIARYDEATNLIQTRDGVLSSRVKLPHIPL
jgi:hypothetical protein